MRYVTLLLIFIGAASAQSFGFGPVPPPPASPSIPAVSVPTGYTGPTVPVFEDSFGVVYTNYDVATLKAANAGKTYWVDVATGNDGNTGADATHAFKTITFGLRRSDVDILNVKAGHYDRFNGFVGNNTITARSIQLLGYGGRVVSSADDSAVTWAADGANPPAFKATRSNAINVETVDLLGPDGDPALLTVAASAAACASTAGSWFTDNVSVWVNRQDGSTPTAANTYVTITATNGQWAGGAGLTLYIENVDFWGGSVAPFVTTYQAGNETATLVFKNCRFGYGRTIGGTAGNGMQIVGTGFVYTQNCSAMCNAFDGFNYHASGANVPPHFVEINDKGYLNGYISGATTNNGSTSHDNALGMRINGQYFGNQGPNLVDVLGASSWNLGCICYGTTDTSGDRSNFEHQNGGAMWLDSCVSNASGVGANGKISTLDWTIGNSGTIKTHGCTFNVGANTGGSLTPY